MTALNRSPAAIIACKRDGHELTADQIETFMAGFAAEVVPDYQMSALAMAIFLRGMTTTETAVLTDCMLRSGRSLEWPNDGIPRVDKHSTGGIGDKVSIVLAPLLACCDVQVPMLSGRGLGPTGGTLDKLEAIPGFRTDFSIPEVIEITQTVGCVITGTSADLAPADRRLYALRDVTATVPSIPLITASIMSKKLAESLNALVLDVKFGSGAFMKSIDDARRLAQSLVGTGRRMRVDTAALLTDMNQPLGRMVGNAAEINECIDVLNGGGPPDLIDVTLALAAQLLTTIGISPSTNAAKTVLRDHVSSGRAKQRYERMVVAQGGNPNASLTVAPATVVIANEAGCVAAINAEQIGMAIIELGGGRRQMTDAIDHSVGIEMLVRIGDVIERGQPLMKIFSADPNRVTSALRDAIRIQDDVIAPLELIAELIDGDVDPV